MITQGNDIPFCFGCSGHKKALRSDAPGPFHMLLLYALLCG